MTEVRWKGVLLQDEREEKDVFLTLAPMYLTVLSASLLFSCGAAKSAQEIAVQVPDHFAGTLQIAPCNASATKDHVTANDKGVAQTSSCPQSGQAVTLVIVRGSQMQRITPENVQVMRAGDGIPVRIQATVPAQ
jgi:hypothetical protein